MRPSLILASQSAARRSLLECAGVAVEVAPARIDEGAVKVAMRAEGASARDVADALAELKARRAAGRHRNRLVLGADQVLVLDGRIFDRPRDRDEARAQLGALRGQRHELLAAAVVCEGDAPVWRHVGRAVLEMRPFSDGFLERYLDAEGERLTATVGAYRIEGPGAQLFARVEGDHFSILGLPLLPLLGFLRSRKVLDE